MPIDGKCPECEISCFQDYKQSRINITYEDLFTLYQLYQIQDYGELHPFKAVDMSGPEAIWKHGFFEYNIHWERPGSVFALKLILNREVNVVYRVNIIHRYIESYEVHIRLSEE